MLILSRKIGESIDIDGQIKVQIVKIKGNRIQIGIQAPDGIQILRSELNDWSTGSDDFNRLVSQTDSGHVVPAGLAH